MSETHGTLRLTEKALAYLAADRPNPFGAIVRPRCYRSTSGCGRWVGDCSDKRMEAGL